MVLNETNKKAQDQIEHAIVPQVTCDIEPLLMGLCFRNKATNANSA